MTDFGERLQNLFWDACLKLLGTGWESFLSSVRQIEIIKRIMALESNIDKNFFQE